jgi:hypothetical protein
VDERREQVEVWVVVRIDHFLRQNVGEDVKRMITLREALPTHDEAEAEAARLNDLRERRGDEGEVEYYAPPARYFPEGRGVEIGY